MNQEIVSATGRRKTSIARVFVTKGKGNIIVNSRPINEYFGTPELIYNARRALSILEKEKDFDIKINVNGGGFRGQSDAIKLGISRTLEEILPEEKLKLKKAKLLTRDPRKVERKKYGQKKARKKFQFSKR